MLWVIRQKLLSLVLSSSVVLFVGQAACCPTNRADEPRQTPRQEPSKSASVPSQPVAGGPIEGIVVDEQGRPVSGASVHTNRSCGMCATTITRADGTFRFKPPWPFNSVVFLIANSPEGTRQGSVWINRSMISSLSHRIVLKPSRKVTVNVVDAAGKPVADATVCSFRYDSVLADMAKTDSQGTVQFHVPATKATSRTMEEPSLSIAAFKSGVGMDYFGGERDSFEYRNERIVVPDVVKLALDGATPFEVQLLDMSGKPLSGLTLRPGRLTRAGKHTISFWDIDSVVTDAQGLAIFDWFPADVTSVSFCASDLNYNYNEDIEFRIQDGGSRERLVAKLHQPACISGSVTTAGGKPAAGVLVQAEGVHASCDYFRDYARTDANGTYRLRVSPNQVYLVGVVEKDWAAPSHVNLALTEGEHREHVDFRLCKGTLLHGRITVGPEKRPYKSEDCNSMTYLAVVQRGPETEIPAAWSCSGNSCKLKPGTTVKCHPCLCRWAEIDAEGRYAIRMCSGKYDLRFPLQFMKPVSIAVARQQEIVHDSHTPKLPGKSFRISTVDSKGNPVPDSTVTYYVNQGERTDKDGRLTILLDREKTALYARNQQANLAGFVMAAKNDKKEEVAVTIVMHPAATVMGRVLDAAGNPVAGAYVFCGFHKRQPQSESCYFRTETRTDCDGKYVISGLFPDFQGELSVSHFHAVSKSYKTSKTVKFDMKAGENHRPDVVLPLQ